MNKLQGCILKEEEFYEVHPYVDNKKSLFRFMSFNIESTEYIEHLFLKRRLYHALAEELNDPFEGKPHFTMGNPANSAQKIRKHLIKSLIKSGQKRKDAEKVVSASMKIPNFVEESMNKLLEEAFMKLRVCCYTTSNKNLLFWSHYADSHKGFCIEFRTDLAPISFAQKVEYTKTYPQVVYPIDNIGGRRMALVKSPDWSYEDEFRSLFIANSCTKMGIPHDGKSYIIPPSSIKNVYLGCQMSQESQDSLLSIIAKSDFTPKLWKASMAKDAFELAFEAI